MAPLIPPHVATAARQLVDTAVQRASDALPRRSLLVSVPAPLPLSLLSPSPSRTNNGAPDLPTRVLAARQFAATTSTIPGSYHTAGPEPGAVVGITLGSLLGFLLLLWLVYTCINMGNPGLATTDATSSYVGGAGTASVVTMRKSSHRHSNSRHASRHASRRRSQSTNHRHHSHSRRRGSVVEVRTSTTTAPPRGGPVILDDEMSELGRPPHVERVVVEETMRTTASRGGPPPHRRMSGGSSLPERGIPVPGPRIVPMDSDDSADEEDEVVVIEERSPPRARRSRRGSGMTGERIYYEQRERSVSRRR